MMFIRMDEVIRAQFLLEDGTVIGDGVLDPGQKYLAKITNPRPTDDHYDKIIATTHTGANWVLLRCYKTRSQMSGLGTDTPTTEVEFSPLAVLFPGSEPGTPSTQINTLSAPVHGLDSWLDQTLFSHDYGDSVNTITYPVRSSPLVAPFGDFQLSVGVSLGGERWPIFHDVSLTQQGFVQLERSDGGKAEYDDFLNALRSIERLIGLSMPKPSRTYEAYFESDDYTFSLPGRDNTRVAYKYREVSRKAQDAPKKLLPFEHLFTVDSAGPGQFTSMIAAWLSLESKASEAINLYLSVTGGYVPILEGEFQALSQACEALHRSLYPKSTKMPKTSFKEARERIISSVSDPNDKALVAGALAYANEPTLTQRLEQLAKDVTKFGIRLSDNFDPVRVSRTRNNMAHPTIRDKKIYPTHEMFPIILDLRKIVRATFLSQLGLPDGAVSKGATIGLF